MTARPPNLLPQGLDIPEVAGELAPTDRAVVATTGLVLVGMPLQIIHPLTGDLASRPEADVSFRDA